MADEKVQFGKDRIEGVIDVGLIVISHFEGSVTVTFIFNRLDKLVMICPHCKSMEVVKMGYYFTKSGEKRQRYKCRSCGRTFVLNPIKPRNYPEEFKEMVVRAVMKEGVGVRQASRIFKLSPKTVIAWKREFSKKRSKE